MREQRLKKNKSTVLQLHAGHKAQTRWWKSCAGLVDPATFIMRLQTQHGDNR